TTKKELPETKNEFISSLHHRSWIIQIAQLKQRRRNDVEKLLSIFDQENRIYYSHYILNVDENDFPERYAHIIHRLRMAYKSEDVRIEMEMEDDYLSELKDKEREIAEIHKELKESKKELKEKDKVLEEQDKAIEEMDKAIEERQKALEEQEQLIETLKAQLAKGQK
ncbi:MAG: hypothetical protein LBB84_04825, partial [Tannerellaceae bacterium]|nr:hypothetical protein [Tannerellaceae bacterium]